MFHPSTKCSIRMNITIVISLIIYEWKRSLPSFIDFVHFIHSFMCQMFVRIFILFPFFLLNLFSARMKQKSPKNLARVTYINGRPINIICLIIIVKWTIIVRDSWNVSVGWLEESLKTRRDSEIKTLFPLHRFRSSRRCPSESLKCFPAFFVAVRFCGSDLSSCDDDDIKTVLKRRGLLQQRRSVRLSPSISWNLKVQII